MISSIIPSPIIQMGAGSVFILAPAAHRIAGNNDASLLRWRTLNPRDRDQRMRGSNRSRRLSPMKLEATTSVAIAMPGNNHVHH